MRAPELDSRADLAGTTRVWLALESMQVTGSFKVRGALVAIANLRERAMARGVAIPWVVAASAGNHGAGVAYAAKALGVRATVVVPRSVPRAKRDRIAGCGAEVRLGPSDHYDDAEAEAKALAAREGAAFLSPYDDADVVAGNGGSLGYEMVALLGRVPENVIAPIGGGGLASGIACALAARSGVEPGSAAAPRVWGVQSDACAAAALSIDAGKAVERLEAPATGTLADGLEGGISSGGFARARATLAGVGVVTEAEIARAMAFGVRELGVVLEGSAACALAAGLAALPEALRGGDLVLVVTGRNVDPETLAGALAAG